MSAGPSRPTDDSGLRYWTWVKIQGFAVEHGLMIATGPADDDEAALTRRGYELLAFLIAVQRATRR